MELLIGLKYAWDRDVNRPRACMGWGCNFGAVVIGLEYAWDGGVIAAP